MTSSEVRRCGALPLPDSGVCFRVWAPKAEAVELVLVDGGRRRVVAMEREERGFFCHEQHGVADGQRYAFRLDGGPERPDPCALAQPDGVHGPSAVARPGNFKWSDTAWQGVRREDLALYEL